MNEEQSLGNNVLKQDFQDVVTIAKGAGIVFVGSIIGTALKYLFELIIAQHLGAALFGIFFLGLAIFRICETVSTAGLHYGVLRYVALYRGEKDQNRVKGTIILSIKVVLATGIFTAFILLFLSNFIAIKIFNKIELKDVIRLFSLGIPFAALTSILIFSTQGFKIMKYKVIVREILEPVLRIVIIIILFVTGFKLFGALFAFVSSIILATILAAFYLKKLFPAIIKKKLRPIYESKKIFNFSWPLFLMSLSHLIFLWTGALMLGYFMTQQDVGIFVAAQRTAFLVTMILTSFNAIFSPMISDIYNKKKYKSLGRLFKIETKWIFSISFPIVLLLVTFSKEILGLFGKDFIVGAPCLIIVSFGQLINICVGSSEFMIMMSGRSKINLLNLIIIFSLNILLNLMLIPRIGIIGAAFAIAISIALLNIIHLIEVQYILKMHPFRIDFYKPLVSGLAALLILKLTYLNIFQINNPLFLLISGGGFLFFIYILILYLLGMEEEERLILNKIFSRLNLNKGLRQ